MSIEAEHELLERVVSSPEVQLCMHRNSERMLGIDRLINGQFVVFERAQDDFWTTVTNSPKRQTVVDRIDSGHIIPVNADALSDIASVHTFFHTYISEAKLPAIPTIVNVEGKISTVGMRPLLATIPNVFVKKVSFDERGKQKSHRGQGVSVVRMDERNVQEHLPRNQFELLQPFIIPPGDYVRDVRVYLVGGYPVAGVIRRAREPLRPENLRGEVLPNQSQYPSAQNPGPKEVLEGELRERVYSVAYKIAQAFDRKVRSRKRPFSEHSTFGYGSIDFLLDSRGTPLPVDFDLNPSVTEFGGIRAHVAQVTAEYLYKLAGIGGLERTILLIGWPGNPFESSVLEKLRSILPHERIVFQEPIAYQAVMEITEKLTPKIPERKVGRNEPCPCGSGKKYKYCHARSS